MNDQVNFNTYQSPFSWRYGSDQMRELFSEVNKRKTWRKVWVALASVQQKAGLLTPKEYEDIKKHAEKIDIDKAHEIEKEIYHDLMAEIRVFADQSGKAGGKIHLGATSMDIEDNADILIFAQALDLVSLKLKDLIKNFAAKIKKYKSTVCMGYTHLQPAEPTTLGYRFSIYAQDLLNDFRLLKYFQNNLKGKGVKGAVGTSASYEQLLKDKNIDAFQLSRQVMEKLGIDEVSVSNQTYPRKTDLHLIFVLASIAQSLHKFAFDLRIMQSPNFGEWSEPTSVKRVGSSAMPFKKNPDKAEKVCSLARYIGSLVNVAFENAAVSLLERTLDDSANRRLCIPEAFLATDEILNVTGQLVGNLVVFEENIKNNLDKFGPFAGTESLMMEAVKNGANRQQFHEKIREISMQAWAQINKLKANPLVSLLKSDKMITKFVESDKIASLINPTAHIGIAQKRCELFAKELERELEK